MAITMQYVDARFAQFVAKYAEALKSLGYAQDVVVDFTTKLAARLAARDFKLYGDKPINFLHAGKRVTRFLLKSAIEHCPAERARREQLHQLYVARARAIRANQPNAFFFSFEATYADKLKVSLTPFRSLFCI